MVGEDLAGTGRTIDWEDIKWAASLAAPYYAPRLTTTHVTGQVQVFNIPTEALKGLSENELALLEMLLSKIGSTPTLEAVAIPGVEDAYEAQLQLGMTSH